MFGWSRIALDSRTVAVVHELADYRLFAVRADVTQLYPPDDVFACFGTSRMVSKHNSLPTNVAEHREDLRWALPMLSQSSATIADNLLCLDTIGIVA